MYGEREREASEKMPCSLQQSCNHHLLRWDDGEKSRSRAGVGGMVDVGKVRTSVLDMLTLRCQLNTEGKMSRRPLDMKIWS